jgi:hypothetical protein
MYTRGKRFILLAVASTAVTCSASFALRGLPDFILSSL